MARRVGMFYRGVWWEQLRAGVDGQRIDKPSTWKLNALWRAAVLEAQAEDARRAGVEDVSELLRSARANYDLYWDAYWIARSEATTE